MNDLSNLHPAASPQQKAVGDFAIPVKGTKESLLLSASEESQTSTSLELTPLQQRKKDAVELAELIYKIYNDNCPALTNKEDGNV